MDRRHKNPQRAASLVMKRLGQQGGLLLSLLLVLWLGLGGGCSNDTGSPCGECPADQRCDTAKKKCVPRCSPCQVNADCENSEQCTSGCCQLREGAERGGGPLNEPGNPSESTPTDSDGGAVDNGPTTPDQTCANPPCGKPCDTDDQCTDPVEPYCHLIKRKCVNCRDSSDCKDGKSCDDATSYCRDKSLCDGVTCDAGKTCCADDGKCKGCCKDSDCTGDEKCKDDGLGGLSCQAPPPCDPPCATGNVCDPNKKECKPDCRVAGCLDSTQQCEQATGLCVDSDCRSNLTCPSGEECDQATGQCKPAAKDCRSNHTCGANEQCDQGTGQCVPAPKDCTKGTLTCSSPQCCDQTSGQCTSHCRACGCPSGQTCNQASGQCQAATCKAKTRCSSSADCCGRSCKAQTGGLGNKHCTCSSSSQCQSGRCRTNFLTKYCE